MFAEYLNVSTTFSIASLGMGLLLSLFLFLTYRRTRERSKAFLATGFFLIAIDSLLQAVAGITKNNVVFWQLSGHYLGALGVIFFSFVIVALLTESERISKIYLGVSIALTSLFAVLCYATVDFSLASYSQHWTDIVWIAVQLLVFGVLTGALGLTWLKAPQVGVVTFGVVFFLWFISRLIHFTIACFIGLPKTLMSSTEEFLEMAALFILLGYAISSFRAKLKAK